MKAFNSTTSACRNCRHFTPEGRRGGNCHQLGVLVRGGWKACSLAIPAFAPSWEGLEGIVLWSTQGLDTSEALPVECCTISCSDLNTPENQNMAQSQTLNALTVLV